MLEQDMTMIAPETDRKAADVPARLLIATERRLVQGGRAAVSLRALAADAKTNSALISYYFGSLQGLFHTVGNDNNRLMIAVRKRLLAEAVTMADPERRLLKALAAHVQPLLHPCAHSSEHHASLVVRELLTSEDEEFKRVAVKEINDSVKEIMKVLGPLLPHLRPAMLAYRLKLLTGAATYFAPQIDRLGLFRVPGTGPIPGSLDILAELLAFAHGAMAAEANDGFISPDKP